MENVSLPMRIALLAVLAFAGLWFVALRPKPPAAAPAPAPAQASAPAPKTGSGITGAPAKAKAGVEKANAATAARKQAVDASGPAAKPAAKPAARSAAETPAPASARPAGTAESAGDKTPKAVQRVLTDIDRKRAVVLLFWDGRNADDREVRRAVSAVDRRGGKVRVHVAKISKLGVFEPITRGVPVVTSPTVLVIGRDKRARAIGGLTVTREIDELAGKALAGK